MTKWPVFMELIGYRFRDLAVLEQALTHPSVAREEAIPRQHNQRLEFLGDAVLQLALTQELYLKFPDLDEGSLTKARAQMVNRHALAEHARRLQLGRFLWVSRGEELSGGRERPSALADAFEALVGAIFLDGGFRAARRFVRCQFRASCAEREKVLHIDNPKGELQELLQAKSAEAPVYRLVAATGPDHDRLFECVVTHQGRELGHGQGRTKKNAESQAAWAALQALRGTGQTPVRDAS